MQTRACCLCFVPISGSLQRRPMGNICSPASSCSPEAPTVRLAFHCRSAIFRATTVAIQLIQNQLLGSGSFAIGAWAYLRRMLLICAGISSMANYRFLPCCASSPRRRDWRFQAQDLGGDRQFHLLGWQALGRISAEEHTPYSSMSQDALSALRITRVLKYNDASESGFTTTPLA